MASKTYIQFYADGTSKTVMRVKKQGRKVIPEELRKVKMDFRTLEGTKRKILETAKNHNMSASSYIDLAVCLFDIGEFLSHKNCSTQ